MEIATQVITPVIDFFLVTIKKEVGYWVSSRKNVEDMGKKMKLLQDTAEDMRRKKEDNDVKNLVVPHHVPTWLEEVEEISKEAASIPTDGIGIGCFNIKMRYKAGKRSSDILEKIRGLDESKSKIEWTDEQILLAKVSSKKVVASTSASSPVDDDTQRSRDLIFKQASKSLASNDSKSHMVALCGMGGVGKTYMMEQLKKHVENTKMFNYVVRVVVGENTSIIAFQHAIAEKTGGALIETTSDARAERLQNRFMGMSKDGENKVLVILDDVWKAWDLEDIGLTSPLPDGFKLLITSRHRDACAQMGVDTNSIFQIGALDDVEAKALFFETVGISSIGDPYLSKIGEDIIKRCGNLPIALKTIASTLKNKKNKESVWKEALSRLQHHDLEDHYETVHKAFEISYNYLKTKDEKALFLLTGLFPDDFDVPVEELVRCGWGLKLFEAPTLEKARLRVENSIESLISANLLAESDRAGCVIMHDLARDFTLRKSTKVRQASIVNHDDLEQLPEDMTMHYQRILLKFTGISKFPENFKCPNLTFLKLMGGEEQLNFPEDFYGNMEKLQVISYEDLQYPLLPRSLQCSTLRTLCLHACELTTADYSSIGDLVNLEVLSFAHCRIEKLPSAIGKLKKLKLLDLTGCLNLSIDDGVFKDLDKLQELYMRVTGQKAIQFTDANCDELGVLWVKLSALEVEFFDNKAQPKDMSFKKLERFKISIGCLLKDDRDLYSFGNTLKLDTNKRQLLDCKIDQLFEKTDNLYLQVKDMEDLKDVSMNPPQDLFSKLRVLVVDGCEDLKYLFTVSVATGLKKLEHLEVWRCSVLESLIHGDESENGGGVITFQKLKFLELGFLPKLMSLWDMDIVVELPQLMELRLSYLDKLTSIYPENTMQQFFNKEIEEVSMHPSQHPFSSLRFLEVYSCESLRYVFTVAMASGLTKLERLKVSYCDVLESLVYDDENENDGDGEMELKFPQLVELTLYGLPKISSIYPDSAMQSFFNKQVVVPRLEKLSIYVMVNLRQIWPCEMTTSHISMVRVVHVSYCHSLVNLFPTNPMPLLRNLETLQVENCNSIKVLFNIDLRHVEEVSSCLRSIQVNNLPKLKAVWRIKGAEDHPGILISGFQAVQNILIDGCRRFINICIPTISNIDMKAIPDIKGQNYTGDDDDLIFKEAFKSLEPNNSNTRMTALCGIGRVGVTNLMEQLKKDVEDLKMFDLVVKLVIGRKANPIALQQTTAEYINGEALTEVAKEARAAALHRRFMRMSQDGKNNILVILDGLWEVLDLKDIGIPTPLPNGFKLLITSQDASVCTQMGVEKSFIFRLGVVGDIQAKELFFEAVGLAETDHPDLYKIGEEIIMRCGNFSISLKTIASVLKGNIKDKSKWEEALSTLQHHHLADVYDIMKIAFEMSYNSLETDDLKAILFLSSYFPEGFDIPVEELMRYAWGLKLFPEVITTLPQARNRIKASIDVLIHANFLTKSWGEGLVKMEKEARDFVLGKFTKVKQALIDHDNMLEDADDSYERIFLQCQDMSEFPVDFNYPNLKLLMIIGQKELLKFPNDFYEKMKNLEVVAYEKMADPLLPQYSTNLRTLCLHRCSLMVDFSFLGNLSNLEILSFAHCGIQTLPSTIGKLTNLKLLDMTECVDLTIEDGVFGKLINLEELCMRVDGFEAIHFTDANLKELEILSRQLCALEVEFCENKLHLKDGGFEKLERFNISLGCLLDYSDRNSSGNILRLETNRSDIVECRIHELFEKTEKLYLQVKDMNRVEDVSMQYLFCNLRELEVSKCPDLTFLFTVHVASGFIKLEILRVSSCPVLKSVIDDESSGDGRVIMLPKLKEMELTNLPSLMNLCNVDNRVELQQLEELFLDGLPKITSIFGENEYALFRQQQVQIPKLGELRIFRMEKLKQIWACETTSTSEKEVNNNNISSMLRRIRVKGCDSVVNLFPCNPFPLLCNLEELTVEDCGSIKEIFNMDLTSAPGNIMNHVTSGLRGIWLLELESLREIWRIKGANNSRPLIPCFQAVEKIVIRECRRFRDIFTPKHINFDIRAEVNIIE